MIPRKSIITAGAVLLLISGAAAAKPLKGGQLARQAKISLSQARAIALHARPGTVTDEELEKEKGGSGLRYSFDIRTRGGVYEIGVDAKTAKVLENAKEGSHPD